ncbi:MAG: type 3 dihydrofolate reductase [Chloroflexi bacterium]|nr:MAG: type 3 dihydrofolate reductase [Chloroflexota bacterium]
MMLSLIVAMDKNRLIGADNHLPWRLPDDMAWFKEKTIGKPVLMGRKTHESIPAKFRPLPGRHNIVVTRNRAFTSPGCTVVHSIDGAIAAAGDVEEVVVAGGAELYRQLLPQVERLYLTKVDVDLDGDAYFPEIDPAEWHEIFCQEHAVDDRHVHSFTWFIWERV